MEHRQFVRKLIERSRQFEVEQPDKIDMSGTHTAFEGTPKKHPANDGILVLFIDPMGTDPGFFEFPVETIGAIEELGTMSMADGTSCYRVRVWIKKGSPGLRSEKFLVE